jgi:hypothetical protein
VEAMIIFGVALLAVLFAMIVGHFAQKGDRDE